MKHVAFFARSGRTWTRGAQRSSPSSASALARGVARREGQRSERIHSRELTACARRRSCFRPCPYSRSPTFEFVAMSSIATSPLHKRSRVTLIGMDNPIDKGRIAFDTLLPQMLALVDPTFLPQ